MSGEKKSAERARVIFKENLRRYMDMNGVDQADLVRDLDLTASTVSDWVRGAKYPRVEKMQKLADYLKVKISDLTSESDEDDLQLSDIQFALMKETGSMDEDTLNEVLAIARILNKRDRETKG